MPINKHAYALASSITSYVILAKAQVQGVNRSWPKQEDRPMLAKRAQAANQQRIAKAK